MLLVNWTTEAENDLIAIEDFIAQDNPIAAMNLSELLVETAEKLAYMPYMGRTGKVLQTRELVAHRNYILVYQVTSHEILILRVMHASKQYP